MFASTEVHSQSTNRHVQCNMSLNSPRAVSSRACKALSHRHTKYSSSNTVLDVDFIPLRKGRDPASESLQPRVPRRVPDILVRAREVELPDLSGIVLHAWARAIQ